MLTFPRFLGVLSLPMLLRSLAGVGKTALIIGLAKIPGETLGGNKDFSKLRRVHVGLGPAVQSQSA